MDDMNVDNLLLLLTIALSVSSCGPRAAPVGAPWNPGDAVFFDDGADLIIDPDALSGRAGFQQKDALEARIQLSDLAAVVEISSLHTESDVDKKESKRLEVASIETLYGSFPRGNLSLKTPSSSPGYELIVRHESYLEGDFILFYRGFKDIEDNGEKVGYHFHLTKASSTLIRYIKQRLTARREAEKQSARSAKKK